MLRLTYTAILLIIVASVTRCTKDVGRMPSKEIEGHQDAIKNDAIDFSCVVFPKWFQPPADSVTFPDKQLQYWKYLSSKKDQIIYTIGGNVWSYNFLTKNRYFLADNVLYFPDCNSNGWVTFGLFTNRCIYKIKVNGDSLKLLAHDALDPHFDFSGKSIFYYNEIKNKLYKIDLSGVVLDSINSGPAQYTGFAPNSNSLFYGKFLQGVPCLFRMDIESQAELVVANNIVPIAMTFDDNASNVYFMADNATNNPILKYNFNTKQTDTLFRSCDNVRYNWPSVCKGTNVLTIACTFTKFLDPKKDSNIKRPKLLRWTKAFEMDLSDPSYRLVEVNIFP